MTALIHLNGPPGIGKSTLAARYADQHPGTLNLDVDTLHHLIGGWRESQGRFHNLLRPIARAMAATHLAGGHDVILPQYVGVAAELAAFEEVAGDVGAGFIEIVLLDDKAAAISRFNDRQDETDWGRHNRELVESLGGDELLSQMHDRLLDLVEQRPDAIVLHSQAGAVQQTYAEVQRLIWAAMGALGA